MASPAPSSFTIEELTGQERRLELRARALPYQEVAFPRAQRHTIDWYPGNPIASLQVLGREIKPTVVKGMWKDRFIRNPVSVDPSNPALVRASQAFVPPALLDGDPVADADALVKIMESICDQGQLLRVTWDRRIREGILHEFTPIYDRRQDIKWEAAFVWISEGEQQGPAQVNQEPDLLDAATTLAARTRDMADAAVAAFEAVQDAVADVNAKITQIQFASLNVSQAVSNAADGVLSPVDAAQRAVGLFGFVATTGKQTIEALENRVDASLEVTDDIASVTLGRKLYLARFNRKLINNTRDVAAFAANQAFDFGKKITAPPLLATIISKAGTDLRKVSSQYYGTPNEWQRLRDFNLLTSSAPPAGTVLHIPVLPLARSSRTGS